MCILEKSGIGIVDVEVQRWPCCMIACGMSASGITACGKCVSDGHSMQEANKNDGLGLNGTLPLSMLMLAGGGHPHCMHRRRRLA